MINTLLFIAGVIPAHIHGFYLSCTYYSRKRKVRKGRFPGGKKSFIYSQRVINGGASDETVEEIWKENVAMKQGRTRSKRMSGRVRVPAERKRSIVGSRCGRGSGRSDDQRTWDERRERRRMHGTESTDCQS